VFIACLPDLIPKPIKSGDRRQPIHACDRQSRVVEIITALFIGEKDRI